MKNKKNIKENFFLSIIGGIVGFVNGFLGGGGGMLCVPLIEKFCKMEEKQAHATTLCVILPLSIFSSFVYIYQNEIEFVNLLLVTIGSVVGGIIGAKLLNKINQKWVRIIFAIIMILAGVKTII